MRRPEKENLSAYRESGGTGMNKTRTPTKGEKERNTKPDLASGLWEGKHRRTVPPTKRRKINGWVSGKKAP